MEVEVDVVYFEVKGVQVEVEFGGSSLRLRGCRRRLKGYSLGLRSGCGG